MIHRCRDCGIELEWNGRNYAARCKTCRRNQDIARKRAERDARRAQKVWRNCLTCGRPMVGAVGPRKRHVGCAQARLRERDAQRKIVARSVDQPAHVIEAAIRANQARIDAARRNGKPVFSTDPWAQRPDRDQGPWRTL